MIAAGVADPSRRRRPAMEIALLIAAGLAAYLPFLGQTWEIGARELRHAEIAREMVARSTVVIPTLFGVEYADKPPVAHLLIGAAYRVAGDATLALARLPSVLAAVAGAVAVYGLAVACGAPDAALLAGLTTLAGVEYQHLAILAKPDMVLAAAITWACLAVLVAMRRRDAVGSLAAAVGGVLAGVATLTKGPIGVGLPVLFAAIALVSGREPGRPSWRATVLFGIGATLAVAAWVVPAWWHDHGAYLHRLASQPDLRGDDDAPRPLWGYVGSLLLGFLPFTLLVPIMARDVRRHGWPVALRTAVAVFVILSLFPKKRPHYLLPIYPFLALAAAEAVQRAGDRRLVRVTTAVAVVALMVNPLRWPLLMRLRAPGEEPKWAMAGRLLEAAPPDRFVVGVDEVAEAVAFRGRRDRVAQGYDEPSLVAALERGGAGTWFVVPSQEDHLLTRVRARVPLRELHDDRFASQQRWRVFRVEPVAD